MDRELKAKKNEVMDAVTNAMLNLPTKKEGASDILGTTTITTHNRQGLTLKGILDVMDGITPMGGILILNTNRPNDIDSAIKRPGRIDIQLTLSRMTTPNANSLIKHLGFETTNLEIPDRLLMGCIVKNLCVFARDQADFEQKLKREIEIQQELLEKKKQEKEETNQMIENIEKNRTEKRFGKVSRLSAC
jgi:SpoVK/Ycf46/Vps4 family AAA+-type ATPase